MGKTVLALLEAIATEPLIDDEDEEGRRGVCPHCFEETPEGAEKETHMEFCPKWRASEVLREYRNSTGTEGLLER